VGTISVGITAPKFSVSGDGTKIILGYLRDFYIFERVDVTFNQLLHYTCGDDIFRAALASDGSYAYIGYKTGTVIIFDTSTQTVIQTLGGISGAGSCRTITPNQDGSLLVVSYFAGKIKIYEMIGGLYYAYGSVYDIPNSPRPKSINMAARDYSLFFLGTLEFEIYVLQRNGS
jgi:WD40 repeat protein